MLEVYIIRGIIYNLKNKEGYKMSKSRKSKGSENSSKSAEAAMKNLFQRSCGEAIIATSMQDLIKRTRTSSGISTGAMKETLTALRNKDLIKLKTYKEDNVQAGRTRIKLTNQGREAWNIPVKTKK